MELSTTSTLLTNTFFSVITVRLNELLKKKRKTSAYTEQLSHFEQYEIKPECVRADGKYISFESGSQEPTDLALYRFISARSPPFASLHSKMNRRVV